MNPKAFLQAAVAVAILVIFYSLAALNDGVGMSNNEQTGVHNVE
jgi:hypothetical protein